MSTFSSQPHLVWARPCVGSDEWVAIWGVEATDIPARSVWLTVSKDSTTSPSVGHSLGKHQLVRNDEDTTALLNGETRLPVPKPRLFVSSVV